MRGPVKLWMVTIVIGVVLKSSIIDAKIIKHIKLAPETQFRDMKTGPETHSTCTGKQVPRYLARSQHTIWCWNPVIDVDDVSISTNEVIEIGDAPKQINVIDDDVQTRPMILHDAIFWFRPTKPQTMLRYQSTMLNINYATDEDDASILINDVTHDDDAPILINDATDDDNVSIT